MATKLEGGGAPKKYLFSGFPKSTRNNENTICTYLNGSGVWRYSQGPDESELLERRVQARHTVAVGAVVAALLLTRHHLFIILAHVLLANSLFFHSTSLKVDH